MTQFDLIVQGGTLVDGTGSPAYQGDVGVRAGRIVAVGDLRAASTPVTLDARERVVTPGFIDAHSHADTVPLSPGLPDDIVLAGLRQGVTTEVCGNCGFSPFPAGDDLEAVERHYGDLADFEGRDGPPLAHATYGGYVAAVAQRPMATNLAPLVGHGTLRAAVMGFSDRRASDDDLARMGRLLDEALDGGAFGLSSGLIYAPAVYASTDELVELARRVARHGRVYATHMRDEMDHVDRAVDELLMVAREAGVAAHISHHKTAGFGNWGRVQQTLGQISAARRSGLDITADAYPYTAGSTTASALLPPWALDGGIPAMVTRLRDRAVRERIRTDLGAGLPGWQNLLSGSSWAGIVIAGCASRPEWQGRRLDQLADEVGQDALELYLDLLVAERGAFGIVLHMMAEADVEAILAEPFVLGGSDGTYAPGAQHPRVAGTFARYLGPLRRERRLFSLEDVVHRCTGATADRFGIRDRGRLVPGLAADLVVLDPATVRDHATYLDPWLPPEGVDAVLVSGKTVIDHGRDTGVRAGRVLSPA